MKITIQCTDVDAETISRITSDLVKMQNQQIFRSIRRLEAQVEGDENELFAMECTEAFARHMVKNLGFTPKDTDYLSEM